MRPRMLVRDVDNLRNFFGRFAPELLATDYGKEIWALYQAGTLTARHALTGFFERDETAADLEGVVREIGDAERDELARLARAHSFPPSRVKSARSPAQHAAGEVGHLANPALQDHDGLRRARAGATHRDDRPIARQLARAFRAARRAESKAHRRMRPSGPSNSSRSRTSTICIDAAALLQHRGLDLPDARRT